MGRFTLLKIKRGLFSRHSITSHTFGDGIEDKIETYESPTIEGVIKMAKKGFIEHFKKLKYEENYIIIDLEGSNDKVEIFKEKEFSDGFEDSSKTVKTWLVTRSKKQNREIISQLKNFRNPKYENNPECEFCYKKVTQVFKDHLLNDAKTEKMVCAKCKKDLAIMRTLVEKSEAKTK